MCLPYRQHELQSATMNKRARARRLTVLVWIWNSIWVAVPSELASVVEVEVLPSLEVLDRSFHWYQQLKSPYPPRTVSPVRLASVHTHCHHHSHCDCDYDCQYCSRCYFFSCLHSSWTSSTRLMLTLQLSPSVQPPESPRPHRMQIQSWTKKRDGRN